MRVLSIFATVALLVSPALAEINLSEALAQIPTCTVSPTRPCLGSTSVIHDFTARMRRQSASTGAMPIDRPVKLSLHE
jgi:hypothetical protein